MNRKGLLLTLAYSLLLFAWVLKVDDYFYDQSIADQLGLAMAVTSSGVLGWFSLKKRSSVTSLVLLIALPALTFPVSAYFIGITSFGRVFHYLILMLGGLLIATSKPGLTHILAIVCIAIVWFLPFDFQPEQRNYKDLLESSMDTRQGTVQRLLWRGELWTHYNHQLQFSTIDAHMVAEGFVQPVLHLYDPKPSVLVLGGDDGLILGELLRLGIDQIVMIPQDPQYSNVNLKPSFVSQIKVEEVEGLAQIEEKFDLIFIDPLYISRLEGEDWYTEGFLSLVSTKLKEPGFLVIQGPNPYLETETVDILKGRMTEIGLKPLLYHTHIPSLGQYSWIIANKKLDANMLKYRLKNVLPEHETRWWNQEAMKMMLSSGKSNYFKSIR